MSLDDIAVSSGAACTAAEPSHVLVALGLSKERALASLRFGIGRTTTEDDVDYAAAQGRATCRRAADGRVVLGVGTKMIEITESAARVINKQLAKNQRPQAASALR